MFKIDTDKTININRGDIASINFKIPIEYNIDGTVKTYYTFLTTDKVRFSVYEKKAYQDSPVMNKLIEILEQTQVVQINLLTTDTAIGDIVNKPVDYWYEIQLNDNETVIGYDVNGAKIFRLYPEGSNLNA